MTDREIVLGLFGARLAKLLLLLITGLDVLSLLEFLGGVDPVMVLAGFVATCMLVVCLASVSILISVHARSTLELRLGFSGRPRTNPTAPCDPSAGAALTAHLGMWLKPQTIVCFFCCRDRLEWLKETRYTLALSP